MKSDLYYLDFDKSSARSLCDNCPTRTSPSRRCCCHTSSTFALMIHKAMNQLKIPTTSSESWFCSINLHFYQPTIKTPKKISANTNDEDFLFRRKTAKLWMKYSRLWSLAALSASCFTIYLVLYLCCSFILLFFLIYTAPSWIENFFFREPLAETDEIGKLRNKSHCTNCRDGVNNNCSAA